MSSNRYYNGNRSSSSSDLVIKGHLPPHGRQRPSTEATAGARSKRKSSTRKQDWKNSTGNLRRPSSAIHPALWDHNSQLSIESVSIPLSSRVHPTHHHNIPSRRTPTRPFNNWKGTNVISKSNSLTQLDHLTSSTRHKPCQSSHSHTDLFINQYDTNQSDLNQEVCSESHHILLDDSVDHLSSEIDVILHSINTGLVLSDHDHDTTDPSLHPTTTNTTIEETFEGDFIAANTTPNTISISNNSQTVLTNNKETSRVPLIVSRSPGHKSDNERCQDEQLTVAAIKIQRWFRRKQKRLSKIKLQQFLQNKREQMKNSLQQSFISEEQVLLDEKKQRREAKMKAARLVAIDKLKKKREEKKKETERIIQEEMVQLEEKGRVKKTKVSSKESKEQKSKKEKEKQKQKEKEEEEEKEEVVPIEDEIKSSENQHEIKSNDDKMDTDRPQVSTTEDLNEKEGNGQTEEGEGTTTVTASDDNKVDEFFKAGKRKVSPSPSSTHHRHQQTNSTMDSIFATLKELEEPSPPLPGGEPTSPVAAVGYLSAQNLSTLQTTTTNDSKLQSILTYLDEVENSSTVDPLPSQESEPLLGPPPLNLPNNNSVLSDQLEAASAVANDVTTTIATQRLELENKNKTIEMLQKALTQQRELTIYHAKEVQKESQKRLVLQKEEYEATVQRHQCFIDQLIDDKKQLNDKCEKLVKELKELDKKSKNKVSTMEDQHAVALEKQKQTFIAAEKLRREKWRGEETQRIKEATIKSLEPEIQRIIARGKAEIQKLKAMHEAELLQSDERVSRRFTQQIEELRVQNAQEKEHACQHERELARQKYEQLAEQEENSYQQLRKKLYSELQFERDKLTAEMNGHNSALDKQIKELKETHLNEITRLKTEQESTIAEIQRTHSVEVREFNERSKIEKQMWEENYLKKQDAILMTREREMRDGLRRERDMEIETVIQKLERETAATKDECERAAESRIKRIREKYETELKEVERSEQTTLQKFNSMKGQLSDLEGQVVKLRSHLRIKEEEVAEINEIATRLTRERDQFADVVRQEFADRLISVEEENRQMKLEVSELQAKHKLELERLQRGKERELAEVHNRVKQALAKKEENHKNLRKQHEAALKRADHLEMLLEQQRKELLKR